MADQIRLDPAASEVAESNRGWSHLQLVRHHWGTLFAQIEREEWPHIRWCAGAWYVAGILYERDAHPPISDATYDALTRHLIENFDACAKSGADMLDLEDLKAGTAMNWRRFPQVYQQIATLYRQGHRLSSDDEKRRERRAEERAAHRQKIQEQMDDLGELF